MLSRWVTIFFLNEREDKIENKAIAMMRRKSPRPEKIYLIENYCQAKISKGRRVYIFLFTYTT